MLLEKKNAIIYGAGGVAEISQVDAFDQRAIENYLGEVVRTAGRIDISFNAVGLGDTQGMPLVEMEQESFALPPAR